LTLEARTCSSYYYLDFFTDFFSVTSLSEDGILSQANKLRVSIKNLKDVEKGRDLTILQRNKKRSV
jgi:hypothetical protein